MADRILITGAGGFIGSHLAMAMLADGVDVVGIDCVGVLHHRDVTVNNLNRINAMGKRFQYFDIDIRDREAISECVCEVKPMATVHLAALPGVRPSVENPSVYQDVNIGGLVNLLDALREHGCGNMVCASSSSVYGNCTPTPFKESEAADEPISPYAATKRAGELICHAYSHNYGMSIASLRYFTVYGPRQRPDLAIGRFMRMVRDSVPIAMHGDGKSRRDYTYISDAVAATRSAIDKVQTMDMGYCRTFNIGSGDAISLRELIDMIGETVGATPRVDIHVFPAADVNETWADISRARTELAYEPAIGLADGLRLQWESDCQ